LLILPNRSSRRADIQCFDEELETLVTLILSSVCILNATQDRSTAKTKDRNLLVKLVGSINVSNTSGNGTRANPVQSTTNGRNHLNISKMNRSLKELRHRKQDIVSTVISLFTEMEAVIVCGVSSTHFSL
jgi:hypothetical protein